MVLTKLAEVAEQGRYYEVVPRDRYRLVDLRAFAVVALVERLVWRQWSE